MTQPSKHAAPLRAARDPVVPSLTQLLLKYHTVASGRLVAVTLRDLAASGIPERALGRVSMAMRVTLVVCIALSDRTRSYLPEALGGTAGKLDASDETLSLANASFARPPADCEMHEAPTPTAAPDSHSSPARIHFDAAPPFTHDAGPGAGVASRG